jgi:hypothetical protein
MEKVEMNKDMKLSEHFTLGEVTKTQYATKDGNIPSSSSVIRRAAIGFTSP